MHGIEGCHISMNFELQGIPMFVIATLKTLVDGVNVRSCDGFIRILEARKDLGSQASS
jgi:hypothetical protein